MRCFNIVKLVKKILTITDQHVWQHIHIQISVQTGAWPARGASTGCRNSRIEWAFMQKQPLPSWFCASPGCSAGVRGLNLSFKVLDNMEKNDIEDKAGSSVGCGCILIDESQPVYHLVAQPQPVGYAEAVGSQPELSRTARRVSESPCAHSSFRPV